MLPRRAKLITTSCKLRICDVKFDEKPPVAVGRKRLRLSTFQQQRNVLRLNGIKPRKIATRTYNPMGRR